MGSLEVVLPWRSAKRLYAGPSAPGATKSTFDRLGFWRAVCGLLTVFLVSLSFGKGPYSTLVEGGGADLIVNGSLAFAAMVLSVIGIHLITRGPARRTLRAGTIRMLRNITLVVLTVIVPLLAVPPVRTIYPDYPLSFPLLFLVCGPLMCTVFLRLEARHSGRSSGRFLLSVQLAVVAGLLALSTTGLTEDDLGAVLLVAVVGLPVFAWWFGYLLVLLYWIARTVMWVGEVHRMLAPTPSRPDRADGFREQAPVLPGGRGPLPRVVDHDLYRGGDHLCPGHRRDRRAAESGAAPHRRLGAVAFRARCRPARATEVPGSPDAAGRRPVGGVSGRGRGSPGRTGPRPGPVADRRRRRRGRTRPWPAGRASRGRRRSPARSG